MGVLAEVVSGFDQSQELEDGTAEALKMLVELTSSKADYFEKEMNERLNRGRILGKGDSADSLYYPISSVKSSKKEYRCITSATPDTAAVDAVGKAVKDMIEVGTGSSIVEGVTKIFNTALEQLLGLSEGSEQYCCATATFIENKALAVVSRLDCIIWSRSLRTTALRERVKQTFACVAYKSVVDITQVSFNDFRAVYAPVLEAGNVTDVKEAITEAKEIYNLLDGGTRIPSKVSETHVQSQENLLKAALPNNLALASFAAMPNTVELESVDQVKPLKIQDLISVSDVTNGSNL